MIPHSSRHIVFSCYSDFLCIKSKKKKGKKKHSFRTYHLPDGEGDLETRGFVDFHTIDSVGLFLSECIPQRFMAGIMQKEKYVGEMLG